MTLVLLAGAAAVAAAGMGGCGPGPLPPAGILIVGMPMIVAERGGIDADAAAAAGTWAGTLLPDAAGAAAATAGATATATWPGLATPLAALPTTSVTFSSIVCVSHGLGRLAS